MDAARLLDPKNDAVFKRLFTGAPHLLAELINAVREHEPPLSVVEILNPDITPADLSGKQIVLDVLARDPEGKLYNVEMQVRAHRAWSARSALYLARAFTQQMKQCDDYTTLKPAIAIHLLDFALFKDEDQAIWCFELRDREQHDVRLGEELQFNLIELPKADRLGAGGPALAAWVAFLKHWQEEQRMNEINYPPVKEAMDRIRDLSDDWAAWHEATRRQMAIMDEKQFRKEAIEEGLAEGRAEGLAEGRAEGRASGLDEGQAKGRIQGQAALLERQLSRRFGPLPEGAHDRLLRATQAQLESWADRVLDARDLTEVFGP
jgi:predicted transposase/invertase (TIGR01784 family)